MSIDPIALKLAEIVLKWGWDKGTSQIEKINSSTPPTKEKIAQACKAYIDNYRHRYGKISVLAMSKPVELENIYAKVQIIEDRNRSRYASPEALEKEYRDSARRSYQSEKYKKKDGIEIANKYEYLMVLGQPGAGKSTFLKRIGLAALQGTEDRSLHHIKIKLPGLNPGSGASQQSLPGTTTPQAEELYIHERIPVLIELKRCDSEQIDLVGKIQTELEICGFESANVLTQALLTKGGMLILLDGLDEIPSQYLDRAITQIQDFVNSYKDNRFIISCRTIAYQGGFNNLVNVEMTNFDDEQIQQFINNWFCREQNLDFKVAESCWQLLNSDGYQPTKELAQTPLLLTFLCLVFDESQVFPKNRAALYKDALDIFLRRWTAEKRIQRDPIYKDLTIQLEEMLLAKIAYEQFSQDRLFFDKQTVIREIQGYLTENLNAPKHLDGEDVLRAIQIQQGILVGRSSDTLSFSHLTLQEYLTAQYIIDRQLIDESIAQHLTNHRWREVFLIVAGSMRNRGDDILRKMALGCSNLINSKKLSALVNWSEETTKEVNSKVNYLARRHLALVIANANANPNTNAYPYAYANAIAHAYVKANTYVNADAYANSFANSFANSYANGYVIDQSIKLIDSLAELQIFDRLDYADIKTKIQILKKQIPNDDRSKQIHREFANKIVQFWCQSLKIELDWLDLSKPEIDNLERYFAANLLIMKCKEASVYISAKGWADIEELMFRVIQLDD
jgi:predicted NACHT family NTPase